MNYKKKINKMHDRLSRSLWIIEHGIEIGALYKDPNNQNNIVVYRMADSENPEGWYSQNILNIASELSGNHREFNILCEEINKFKKGNSNEKK